MAGWVLRALVLATLSTLPVGTVCAQFGSEDDSVALSARWQSATTAVGHEVTLEVSVLVGPGWHIYGPAPNDSVIPSVLSLEGAAGLEPQGDWSWPTPKHKAAAGGVEAYDYHTGKIVVSRKFLVTKVPTAVPTVRLDFQACTDSYCLNPSTLTVPAPLSFTGLEPSKPRPLEVRQRPNDPAEVIGRGVADVSPGQAFDIAVQFALDPGWYIYGFEDEIGLPTKVLVHRPGPFTVRGTAREPKPKRVNDPAMGGEILKHSGSPVFFVPLQAPEGLAPGRYTVGVHVDYMVCKEICLAPVEKLELEVEVWVGPVAATDGASSSPESPSSNGGPSPREGATMPRPGAASSSDLGEVRVHFEHPEGRYTIDVAPVSRVTAASDFELAVTVKLPPAWHIYGLRNESSSSATLIQLAGDAFHTPEGKQASEPKPKEHRLNGETSLIHERSVTFKVPVRSSGSLADGVHLLRGNINGQVCHDDIGCVILDHDFAVPIGVGRDTVVPEIPKPDAPQQGASTSSTVGNIVQAVTFSGRLDRDRAKPGEALALRFEGEVASGLRIPAIVGNEAQQASQGGLLAVIWASVLAAFVALLTPCVYPMIPITISVFTKQAESRETNVVGLAFIFCAGIVVTFTSIGFLLSAFLGSTGANALATHWAVNLGIGLLFLWFAGSLFGYYNIQLPNWLTQRATSTSGSGGVASVLFMGFVFSVTTFTCVGPIVSTLLALAVTGGTWYAAAGMLAFSATFAIPFFFLALFPKFLSGLPRSGGWLNCVKVVLGFLEVAAAWKFFCVVPLYWGTNPLFRELVLAIWGLVFVATSAYLLGWIRFPHDSPVKKLGIVRLGSIVFFLALAVYCFWGATGRLLDPNLEAQLSPSHSYFEEKRRAESENGVDWLILSSDHPRNYDEVMAELRAKTSRKPILINFTGHT